MTEDPPPPERQEPGDASSPTGPQPGETPTPPPTTGGYPTPSGPGPAGPPSQLSSQDERTWGMLAHLSALVCAIIALAFIGPLVIMLTQGQKSAYVRRQAVDALNFQITTYIAAIVSFLLVFVFLIGLVLLPIVGIGWLVLTIMASLAANRGEDYRYPVNLRLVK